MDWVSALCGIGIFIFAGGIVWVICIGISGVIEYKIIKMVRVPALEDCELALPLPDNLKYATRREVQVMIKEAMKEGRE